MHSQHYSLQLLKYNSLTISEENSFLPVLLQPTGSLGTYCLRADSQQKQTKQKTPEVEARMGC